MSKQLLIIVLAITLIMSEGTAEKVQCYKCGTIIEQCKTYDAGRTVKCDSCLKLTRDDTGKHIYGCYDDWSTFLSVNVGDCRDGAILEISGSACRCSGNLCNTENTATASAMRTIIAVQSISIMWFLFAY